jgi:AAA-like domain
VKQPITYVHENIVFSGSIKEPWALYRLDTKSYPGLPTASKLDLMAHLRSFAYFLEADFQILRVSRKFSVDDYVNGAMRTMSTRRGHQLLFEPYLRQHRDVLSGRHLARPEVFLAVRLRDPSSDLTSILNNTLSGGGLKAAFEQFKDFVGLNDARGIGRRELADLAQRERRAYDRVYGDLDCQRASTEDVQWLVRRNYTRGIGEPTIDRNFRPQALSFDDDEGERRFEPVESDLLRLHDSRVEIRARSLLIDSERGQSHQAMLVVGALPEESSFPGPDSELLFAPFENLDFPGAVDVCFHAEFVPNNQALALARKRKIDADNVFDEESHGDHGPSADSAQRPLAARELEEELSTTDRPPLLRGTITIAVGAPSAKELEERVERLRGEFGRIQLHRPAGEQHRLFMSMLPAQPAPVNDYKEHLLLDQFAATVPIASNWAGSEIGPYIGHTLSGSMQPILFDLAEACQTSRPPTIFIGGTLGSGKTILLQTLLYQGFMQGSRVIDIDPKGDHHLDRLPGVAEHLEVVELTAGAQWRGLLDPLRVGHPDVVFDLTVSFLAELLPDHDEWVLAVEEAVQRVLADSPKYDRAPTCWDVIRELEETGEDVAINVARALRVRATSGLAQLGFAHPDHLPPPVGEAQVTSIQIRNLPRAAPGIARAEYTQDEKIGQAILRLVAMFAMTLAGGDKRVHKVLGFDEVWFLLQGNNSVGYRLVNQLARWGRAENATPILITHMVADAEQLDNLIGTRFIMGMESDEEAGKALKLLGLDPDDTALRQRLQAFRRGRAILRDHHNRTVQMQVDVADTAILAALDTTPGSGEADEAEDLADASVLA